MRFLVKGAVPVILENNHDVWLEEFLADPSNKTKRYRYRHADIKIALKHETGWKCAYCESKIGHNTAGDVEHKIPTSKVQKLHFSWSNLTCACSECNRRKRDYYAAGDAFIDPYVDDVEDAIRHLGPLSFWKPGHKRAEILIRILEFGDPARATLVQRKIEKINEFANLVERYLGESDSVMKSILLAQLRRMRERDGEYSAMLVTIGKQMQIPD